MLTHKAKSINVNGIDTRYYEAGEGPSLLLIHGGGFDYRLNIASDDWAPLFGVLSESFHVVAFDKLGAGETDGPREDTDYTMAATIEHAKAFVREIGLKDYVAIGNSRGALPAARLAVDNPDLVRAVVVIDSNTLPAHDPALPKQSYFPEDIILPDAATIRLQLENVFQDPTQRFAREYLDRKAAWRDAVEPRHKERPMTVEATGRVVALEQRVFRPNVELVKNETLDLISQGQLKQPTLAIWAFNDVSAPFWLGVNLYKDLAASVEHAEFHVFNKGKHLVHVEYPEEVAAVIRSFLSMRGISGE